MPNYVENGYSENYVEGDTSTPQNETTQCDLSEVLKELKEIKTQNALMQKYIASLIDDKFSLLVNAMAVYKGDIISNNEDMKDEIIASVISARNVIQSDIKTTVPDNVVTTEYIDSKVPFVDDKGVDVYPKGTAIISKISSGIFVIESSSFLPDGEGNYSVVYVVSKFSEKDNPKRVFSNMHSSYVKEAYPELYFMKEDYPDCFPESTS